MGILTDIDIRKFINKKDLVIHPYSEECITGVGYDLRIGIIKPLNEIEKFYEDEKLIKIPPKCYCIIITEEFVWLSKRLIGTLHSKGTLSAKGLYTNATNVDPNFKGQMIMSVINISDIDVIITKDSLPTFITLLIHEVRTPTQTLVGVEGTKNSTRVLYQMLRSIYTDKVLYEKQINNINELLLFMNQKNHDYAPPFEDKIVKAKALFHPLRREKFKTISSRIISFFKLSFSNVITWIAIIAVAYFLFDTLKTLVINKELSKDDSKILILLLITIIGLWTNTRKKE